MAGGTAFIGFGEAASAFAHARSKALLASAYDVKTDSLPGRAAKLRDYAEADVTGCLSPDDALAGADTVFCLVTADQALAAAEDYAPSLSAGALWLDMNSVAPETKRAAARAIEAAGGRYVDVAVMAPVHPAALAVPLLVSGSNADAGRSALQAFGFSRIEVLPKGIGAASAVKMIRSIMVKGIEALTAECMLAADAAGVRDSVLASLNASASPADWAVRADYNLDRMIVHGTRRAAEMEEVVKTLESLGTPAPMSRSTADWQRRIGGLGLSPPQGLDAKLTMLLRTGKDEAA
jgi:3-hydroxyisobutyrate dehydrogenase-like beta-hydroxyacid dehydrogenase